MTRGGLVGRGEETARLGTALAAARSGRGGAVFVTGEPGVGKTRLATEAMGTASAAGMVVLQGQVGTVGSVVPYRPLVEALLSLARSGRTPAPDELGRYAEVLDTLRPDAPPTAALSPLMVGEAVLRLLTAVGRRHGCLLVLDDLQDADTETLAVVEYLLDKLAEQPVVLLLVSEDEPCTATDLAARARQRGTAPTLELGPLGRADIHLLVAAGLGVAPAEVGAALVDRVAAGSAGVPFVVGELVRDLTRHAGDAGGELPVPAAVARSVRRRIERLGSRGREVLGTAALFGHRFPLPVLQHAVGGDEHEVSAVLRAAVAAYLLERNGSSREWYDFRPRLAAEAVLDDLGPAERARYARRAAAALIDLYPGLPGPWCARAAELMEHAGETGEAVRLYCDAGRRLLTEGSVEAALPLLTRAHRAAGPGTPPELRCTALELLLHAVARGARFDRLAGLATDLDALGDHDVPAPRRAGLHAQLADAVVLAGRPADALRHLDTARRLLGDRPDDAHSAPVDLAAARVEQSRMGPDRLAVAAGCARRAAEAAGRAGLPAVTGAAQLALGLLARGRDEPAAVAHFARADAIARAHGLPALRVAVEVQLARVETGRDGRTARVEQARQEALRMGVLPLARETGCALVLEQVLRGEFEAAGERIHEGTADAARSASGREPALLRLAEAVRWAHQGRRAAMQRALDELGPAMDDVPGVRPLSYGLARAFCSLLEEDRDAAEREFALALAYDTENPATGDYGRYGVMLLLGVLAGREGWEHHAGVTRISAGGTRWNRQFVHFAHAVLLGRAGRPVEATAAAAAALEAAEPYPVARALCLRLVAAGAREDGWGDPVAWAREAEEYFHAAGVPAVAGACRGLLREMGAPIRQRRTGTDHVPPGLRRHGVTAREYEVARLLTERIANKDIAVRLHISPRTVEKHVASLLHKTGHTDRSAFAAAVLGVAGGLEPYVRRVPVPVGGREAAAPVGVGSVREAGW